MAGQAWQLERFGICVAGWLQTDPPIEWRKAVHLWVRRLSDDALLAAARETALDRDDWSGWYCEVPGAGNALVVVVAYYLVHTHRPVARCVEISTLPRARG